MADAVHYVRPGPFSVVKKTRKTMEMGYQKEIANIESG